MLTLESWGSYLTSGKPAPNFLVESGESRKLSLDMVRGRVIVLFYENRRVIRQNLALKDELTKVYLAQPEKVQQDIFRLVVIDCSEAILPTLPIWRRQLKMHSIKEGFTIYGDWHRTMFKDYRMEAADSNFLIIDKQGVIRYSATGKIDPCHFDQIKELLFSLL
ncbi:MAG: redoxin domain-containing protein [Deltaproteobacteria bacterium]|nr:redoxin domain-containing protein [Deltaproteobacteria bacterium]